MMKTSAATHKYQYIAFTEKRADAIASYINRNGNGYHAEAENRDGIWFVVHSRKLSVAMQTLLTGFVAGWAEAMADIE